MTSSTFGLQYIVKFNKYLNIKNLVVCKTTSEDNNKQYLVSHFNKHDTFLRVLFFKRTCTLRHSSYIFWPDSKCSNWNCSNIWINTLHHFNGFFFIENVKKLVLLFFNWTGDFLFFLFMVTGRAIVFICTTL